MLVGVRIWDGFVEIELTSHFTKASVVTEERLVNAGIGQILVELEVLAFECGVISETLIYRQSIVLCGGEHGIIAKARVLLCGKGLLKGTSGTSGASVASIAEEVIGVVNISEIVFDRHHGSSRVEIPILGEEAVAEVQILWGRWNGETCVLETHVTLHGRSGHDRRAAHRRHIRRATTIAE